MGSKEPPTMAKFLVAIKAQNKIEQEHKYAKSKDPKEDWMGRQLSSLLTKE
jgi:hypothetical protein